MHSAPATLPSDEAPKPARPCAQVAELVDALASGASGHYGRGRSSLLLGTTFLAHRTHDSYALRQLKSPLSN